VEAPVAAGGYARGEPHSPLGPLSPSSPAQEVNPGALQRRLRASAGVGGGLAPPQR